jgi:dUTP pyrophosphatase
MNTIKMIVNDEMLRPVVGTVGSAGYDLKLALDVVIKPGGMQKVGTGVRIEIPEGYVGLVVPRSSCTGVILENIVGVIDSDYQGEISMKLLNTSRRTYLGYKGDRVMQLVIVPCFMAKPIYVKEFDKKTDRGEKGYGSTGK